MATKIALSFGFAALTFLLTNTMGFFWGALIGAGHGSVVLGYPFLSPVYNGKDDAWICFGPYIWGVIACLMFWTSKKYVCALIIILLAINYIGTFWDIIGDLRETGTSVYLFRTIQTMPMIAVPLMIAYLIMQVAVYWRIVKSVRN